MKPRMAFCPTRNFRVRMIWNRVTMEGSGERSGEGSGEGSGGLGSPLDIVCLDADTACTDPYCPVACVPSVRMIDRLRRYEDPRPWDDLV